MVDVAALRSLITLESAGTVAATADVLGYTPSAISQQLKRLERELGVPLTERVGRGVVLTAHGRLAIEQARELVDGFERLRAEVGDPAYPRGPFRLACFSTAERGLVAPMTRRLRDVAPELDLTVMEYEPPEAAVALERGEVDAALLHTWVGLPAHLPPQIATEEIGQDVADLVVPAGHRLAGRPWVTPADLIDEPWACVHTGSVCHQWLLQMFSGSDAAPHVRYWSSEFASQIAYVEAGSAIALIPRLGRGALPEAVTTVEVREPTPRRPVVVAWRVSRAADPALALLRRLLREAETTAETGGRAPDAPRGAPPERP